MPTKLTALLLCACLALAGCWDRTEIEDTAYVISLGMDAAGDGEYLWIFRFARPEQRGTGAQARPGPQGLASAVEIARAATLVQATQIIQANLGRVVSLTQLRQLLIGEELARQGITPIVSQLIRHHEVRLGVGLSVAKGPARELMKVFVPVFDTNPAKVFEGFMLVNKRVHTAPPVRFQQFYTSLLAAGEDPVAVLAAINPYVHADPADLPSMAGRSLTGGEFPRTGGNPTEQAGTAVFRRDRLVGYLSVDETAALLAFRGRMGKVYSTWSDPLEPGQTISIRLGQENKPKIRTGLAGGKPRIHIKLQIEGEVLAVTGKTSYTFPKNRRILERYIARAWEKDVIKPLLSRVYGEWGADPAGFGHAFRKNFASLDAWLAWQWPDRIRDLQVTVETDFFVRRFGLLHDVRE